MQVIPEVVKVAPVRIQKEIKREVLVKTNAGSGSAYSHPANPHYNNPITAVHHVDNIQSGLSFETSDGVIGAHPAS